jgi:hypothetical protein
VSLIAQPLYGHPDGCASLRTTLEESSTGLGGSLCTGTITCSQDLPFLSSGCSSFIVRLSYLGGVRRVL